jgi:serine/threonine protein kinase
VVRAELTAGARIDRFEIVSLLGRGGMGAVYEARDPGLGRRVALKVIAEPERHLSMRLLREAQALAQLQHPNVVAVHEVGTDGDEVFIAMELVDGTSLDKVSPRPATWREVVDLFVQAGHGLVAAHDQGLVHRDVKPANMFVGRDGRVRVGDFGLARRAHADAPAASGAAAGRDDPSTATTVDAGAAATVARPDVPAEHIIDASLTHEGAVLGTPKYMAPEQLAGGRATPLSDQYSFCVALEELLPDGEVPRWLSRAIERGRARDPARRHPSLHALVELLEETPRRRRRRAAVAGAFAATAAIAAGFAVVANRDTGAPACSNGPARMIGVWDAEHRAAIDRAFAATNVPYAAGTFARVANALDRRRDEWLTMYREACEATEIHRTQSPEMLDRRMACLDEQRVELVAFVDRLAAIDGSAVDDADTAVAKIGRVARCADIDALARGVPAPTDPADRARYDALLAEIARLRAGVHVGDWQTTPDDAARVAAEADARGWKRIAASAKYYEGQALAKRGASPGARTALEAAARSAADAEDDYTAMQAWVLLVPMLIEAGDFPAARALLTAADAAVRRGGNPPEHRVSLMQSEGWIEAMSGNFRGAKTIFVDAVAKLEAEAPDAHDTMIQAIANLATIETQLGDHADAIAHRRRVLALAIERYGAMHPTTAEATAELGQAIEASGDLAGARAVLVDAVAAMEKLFGPDSTRVATALQTLANAQDDSANALPYIERAVAIHMASDTAGLGRALIGLAQTQIEVGDNAAARATAEKALSVIEKRLGTENLEYAAAESAYGMAVGCAAKKRLDHAVAILTKELGPDHGLTTDAVATRQACR